VSLIVLTGASGSGKTAIAKAVAARFADEIDVYHFDDIGVPPLSRMTADYGSPAGWQRAMTFKWLENLGEAQRAGRNYLLEGQIRLAFLEEAAAAAGIAYLPLLVDCDDETRRHRLAVERRQPKLANAEMMTWAAFLRREAVEKKCAILDTSRLSLDQSASAVVERFQR
jgi:dephospho-CoA kinase